MQSKDTTFKTLLVVANSSVKNKITSQPHMMVMAYQEPLLGYRFHEIIVAHPPFSTSEREENANLMWLSQAKLKLKPNGLMVKIYEGSR